MRRIRRVCQGVVYAVLLSAPLALAQPERTATAGSPAPSHVSFIEGQVSIERESRSEPAAINVPILDGDRLRTGQGRAEVILADGSLLHIDESTTVDVLAADLFRLLQGRVCLIVRGAGDPGLAIRYQADTRIASVQTGGPGEFRVSAVEGMSGAEVELTVYRGRATLANELGSQDAGAGETALVREGLAPGEPRYFNSARWDAFDRWSMQRRDALLGAASAQYLPADLGVYASTFDRYGTWREERDAGSVWYPSVGRDWRPYSVGYWRDYPAWDAFWVSSDPWGWPTHHYGRWGYSDLGWYWMPSRAWGPSWVYWALSPGYVSWCALGRFDRPVFGLFGLIGSFLSDLVDPWLGWNIVDRRHYGVHEPVYRVAFDGHRLGRDDRGRFAVQRHGPGAGAGGPRGIGSGTGSGPRSDRGFAGGGSASPRNDRPLGSGGPGERRAFPAGQPQGEPGRRTDSPRATPDVAVFSNRRDGSVYRAAPGHDGRGGGSLAGPPRSAAPRSFGSPGLPPNGGSASSRDNGGFVGSTPRAAAPRAYGAPGLSPNGGSTYSRGGGSFNASPRAAAPRAYGAPGLSPNGGSTYSRGGGSFNASPRAAAPRSYAPASPPSSGPSYRRGDSGGSGGSPSRSSAPRYNPGSSGSRPSGGGRSSSGSRGPGRNRR